MQDMVLSRIAIYSTRTDSLKRIWENPFSFAQKVFTFFDRPKSLYDGKPMPFEMIPTHCSVPDYRIERDKAAMFEAVECALLTDYKIGKWEWQVDPEIVDAEIEETIRLKLWKLFNGRMYGVFQLPYFVARCFLTMIGLRRLGRKMPNIKRGVICSEVIFWWFIYHALYYEWDDLTQLLGNEYKPDNFHSLDAFNVTKYCEEKGYLKFYR